MKIYVIPRMGRMSSYLLGLALSHDPKVNFFGFVYCESRGGNTERATNPMATRFRNRNMTPSEALKQIKDAGSPLHNLAKSTIHTIMELVMDPKGGDNFILGRLDAQVVNGLYARFILESKPNVPSKEERQCHGFVLTFKSEKLMAVERFDKPKWLYLLDIL